jgi:galactose mutarotase-like enzyme
MSTRPPVEDQRPAETTAGTGDQWVIGHGHQRAVITEVGATLRSFTVEDRAVIEGFGPNEWSHGGRGQVLAPWPNRLGDGRYTFDDVAAQAPLNELPANNAIHGLVRWMPWRMVGRAQNRVSMSVDLRPSPAYPFALRLTVEYRLGRDGLTVVADADNIGTSDLPFGLGFHPYLTVGTAKVDQIRLRVPAEHRLLSDDRGLPTGSSPVGGTEFDFGHGRLIGVTRLDTAFTDLRRDADGRARIDLDHPDGGAGMTLWADERFGYVMIYSGDTLEPERRRTSLAVEPMSCPPDAFRSGTDLAVIRPGARWTGTWGMTPR